MFRCPARCRSAKLFMIRCFFTSPPPHLTSASTCWALAPFPDEWVDPKRGCRRQSPLPDTPRLRPPRCLSWPPPPPYQIIVIIGAQQVHKAPSLLRSLHVWQLMLLSCSWLLPLLHPTCTCDNMTCTCACTCNMCMYIRPCTFLLLWLLWSSHLHFTFSSSMCCRTCAAANDGLTWVPAWACRVPILHHCGPTSGCALQRWSAQCSTQS